MELCQLLEHCGPAFFVPAAMTNIECEFLLNVRARERLARTATEMRLPLLDHAAIVEYGADVSGDLHLIGGPRADFDIS